METRAQLQIVSFEISFLEYLLYKGFGVAYDVEKMRNAKLMLSIDKIWSTPCHN